jgi:hypothetical protein
MHFFNVLKKNAAAAAVDISEKNNAVFEKNANIKERKKENRIFHCRISFLKNISI